MSDLYSIVAGIALGLSLGIPPGPVNAAIAAAAARRSYVDGIKIGLGAMTSDFTYLILTVIGGLILLYFAYATLKSYKKSAEAPDSTGTGNHYLMGLVMGLTNPMGIIWWVTAGAAFVAMFNVFGVIGFMLGLFSWVSCFSVFVHYAGKKVKIVYPAIIIGSGLMMLFFGLMLLYEVVRPALGF
ncbi:MAG TPA: LysE family transporter [Methanocella sp.]